MTEPATDGGAVTDPTTRLTDEAVARLAEAEHHARYAERLAIPGAIPGANLDQIKSAIVKAELALLRAQFAAFKAEHPAPADRMTFDHAPEDCPRRVDVTTRTDTSTVYVHGDCVPAAECPCLTWAIADMRTAHDYGREHHPACDGTGQRKDER